MSWCFIIQNETAFEKLGSMGFIIIGKILIFI